MNDQETPNKPLMAKSREKVWAELTESEKIERLRQDAQNRRYLLNRICDLESQVSLLKDHTHTEQGVSICIKNAGRNRGGELRVGPDPLE